MKKLVSTNFSKFYEVNEFVAQSTPMRTHYQSRNPLERWIWHGKLEVMKKMLRRIDYKKVLDIGCGDGGLLETLSPKSNYTGIDISPTQLAYFKSVLPQLRKQHPGKISLKLGDAKNLPFQTSTFDLVLACDVLEHVLEPQTTLHEIKRVLKPGGVALFSIPNEPVWQLLRLLTGRWPPRSPDHINYIESGDVMNTFPYVVAIKFLPFPIKPIHLIQIMLSQKD